MADKELSGAASDVYRLLGDLKLDFDHANSTVETYDRELNLDTTTVTVKYSVGGIKFTRQHFASNPDQAIVTKISSSKKGSLSFTAYLGLFEWRDVVARQEDESTGYIMPNKLLLKIGASGIALKGGVCVTFHVEQETLLTIASGVIPTGKTTESA